MNEREAFLARVRQAVKQGNRAGAVPPLPERGSLGYQGAGADPVARFCQEFEAAGGKQHVVPDALTALDTLFGLLRTFEPKTVLLGSGPVIDHLDLAPLLMADGLTVTRVADLDLAAAREAFFAADVGITGVEYLVAETGSLIVESNASCSRSESLLPPVHIAIAGRSQLVADLFDIFPSGREMPSALTVITGPSKTGDIELRLVTGVHGPGEVHVILMEERANQPS
jgi:L-lactate utilization protein LutC